MSRFLLVDSDFWIDRSFFVFCLLKTIGSFVFKHRVSRSFSLTMRLRFWVTLCELSELVWYIFYYRSISLFNAVAKILCHKEWACKNTESQLCAQNAIRFCGSLIWVQGMASVSLQFVASNFKLRYYAHTFNLKEEDFWKNLEDKLEGYELSL
jgi:hypothetical protein